MAFEVIKRKDGSFGWRIRDENGDIVKVTPGQIMLPPGSEEALRRSQAALQKILARDFEAQSRS